MQGTTEEQRRAFQFPTGWNSTIGHLFLIIAPVVSIPNGMEFYFAKRSKPAKIDCFNSQRDGILLYEIYKNFIEVPFQFPTGWNSTVFLDLFSKFVDLFQFPTGWNSTHLALLKQLSPRSFNSQRDGILPKRQHQQARCEEVSIPNGMEFYPISQIRRSHGSYCFNSQRDGILPRYEHEDGIDFMFQFPTGWNSTK